MPHILVVDDSAAIADALRWVLADAGHTVTVVTHGMGGLLDPRHDAWKDTEILVCDLMMPGVKGADILQSCAENHPAIKRICLTGVDAYGPLIEEARQWAHLVLEKPADFTEILKAVGHA